MSELTERSPSFAARRALVGIPAFPSPYTAATTTAAAYVVDRPACSPPAFGRFWRRALRLPSAIKLLELRSDRTGPARRKKRRSSSLVKATAAAPLDVWTTRYRIPTTWVSAARNATGFADLDVIIRGYGGCNQHAAGSIDATCTSR